jgi:putative endonuclease
MSNALSERFVGRRPAKRESKDPTRKRLAKREPKELPTEGGRWQCRRVAHYVYMLRCADDSLYVGETSDLLTRETHHNEGRGGSYTAKRLPVHIVYAEQYSSKEDALKRERQIKRWSSQKKELLIRALAPGLLT